VDPAQLRFRRDFLRLFAASPLLAAIPAFGPTFALSATARQAGPQLGTLLPQSAADAISVMDFEAAARRVLPPAHWGYMASGVDDDATLKANRDGFAHYRLRPRRLVDVSSIDLRTDVFGTTWDAPIFICPAGGLKMFHADGELAVARAAAAKKTTQILSSASSVAVEDVARALGAPPWYQLYMPNQWDGTERLVRRVEATGCPVLVWTIDLLGGRSLETAERFRRTDARSCTTCHSTARGGRTFEQLPMFSGITGGMNPAGATWLYVDRLKKLTRMKLVLKGVETREDARLAREHGVDGIIVSNHGGRAAETGGATIDELAEVIDGAGAQMPVFVDGGFRRGTDIFKALTLGARAVGIGRPYMWALSAFGEAGVVRVIDILRAELTLTMRQCGTPRIRDISRNAIARI
jgi:4-hydroxymandelate oxidase